MDSPVILIVEFNLVTDSEDSLNAVEQLGETKSQWAQLPRPKVRDYDMDGVQAIWSKTKSQDHT